MLPKIQAQSVPLLKRENVAQQAILEDHLKNILAKSENKNYKPWKNKYAPKNSHTPFGNYAKEYMPDTKLASKQVMPDHEVS